MTSPSLFYREIPLTRGQVTIVDAADYEWLNQWKWLAISSGRKFYAARAIQKYPKAKQTLIYMHLFILGRDKDGDHINCDSLDNRRENLRPCTAAQNAKNKQRPATNKSGFKGVQRANSRWRVLITANGQRRHVGTFSDPREAAKAYNREALKAHGEFANLNKID